MTEDGVKYARRLAAARGTSTEPDAALAAMLEQWNLGLGRSAAERRTALRLAKERAELLGEFTTEDEPEARAFIAECRKALAAPVSETAQQPDEAGIEDDVDAYLRDEDPDTDDADLGDDAYYSDAFGES
jgi:hypothetical protein